MKIRQQILAVWLLMLLLSGVNAEAATRKHRTVKAKAAHTRTVRSTVKKSLVSTRSAGKTKVRAAVLRTNTRASRARRRRHYVAFNPWTEPTFADSTAGDNIDGEDLVVRKAAVDALGPYNGTVVIADPNTGRLLSVVNQKLAMRGAYQPCSTVKVVVSLASLAEGIVNPGQAIQPTRRAAARNLGAALAWSNNYYFARLGQQLGYDRVSHYAKLYGIGEKAGLDIQGEEAGTFATETPKSGIGMMTSFGDGIRITPLELTSIMSAVANGGKMYYLQYPKSEEQAKNLTPKLKREFAIANVLPDLKAGMSGAVTFGTARRASYHYSDPILGKTGTCTDTEQPGVHLGWFGSFNDSAKNKLVVVVLLTGGRGISGPVASGVAGNVYHNLAQQNYFGGEQPTSLPMTRTISYEEEEEN